MLADDLADRFVAELACGSEEAQPSSFRDLDGLDVREGDVSHVNPEVDSRVGDLLLALALQEVPGALVGGVQGIKRIEIVHDGADDEWGVDGGETVGVIMSAH